MVIEFTESLQVGENGIGAENADSSENPELTNGAERENVVKDSVSEICRKMAGLPESDKPAASHLTISEKSQTSTFS
ncbi:MAG: hypothetical protein WCR46_02380 [Deltaproteobacteria bacterium]